MAFTVAFTVAFVAGPAGRRALKGSGRRGRAASLEQWLTTEPRDTAADPRPTAVEIEKNSKSFQGTHKKIKRYQTYIFA